MKMLRNNSDFKEMTNSYLKEHSRKRLEAYLKLSRSAILNFPTMPKKKLKKHVRSIDDVWEI